MGFSPRTASLLVDLEVSEIARKTDF